MIFPNPFRAVVAAIRIAWYRLRGYEILAEPEEQQARLETCWDCEEYVASQCRVCTCFLDAKTSLLPEQCPKGKWLRVKRKKPLTARA